MASDKKIKPELPGGVKDYLPQDALQRENLIEKIKGVFSLFGFVPLSTAMMEKVDVLTGGDAEFDKEIFYCSHRGELDSENALRFDLTVPLARVVAAHADTLSLPLKRYEIGTVWRGERQQLEKGRFREFLQCDADIVGSASLQADAEIIALVWNVFKVLDVDVVIRVNNRKVLEGLSEYAEYEPEKNAAVLRVLDKAEKVGWSEVEKELIKEVGLSKIQTSAIQEALFSDRDDSLEGVLSYGQHTFSGTKSSLGGIEELYELAENVRALGVPDEAWTIDYTIARGLSYYTGMVFETTLVGSDLGGSVCSGGRYDGLVSRFSAAPISGVGMSVGIDRLLATPSFAKEQRAGADVLVLSFDQEASVYTAHIATALRNEGVSCELYVGQEKSLKGQLSYAVKKEYPVVCIAGAKEQEQAIVQVKNISRATQQEVPLADVVAYVRSQI